jgi:hypothetical protein
MPKILQYNSPGLQMAEQTKDGRMDSSCMMVMTSST